MVVGLSLLIGAQKVQAGWNPFEGMDAVDNGDKCRMSGALVGKFVTSKGKSVVGMHQGPAPNGIRDIAFAVTSAPRDFVNGRSATEVGKEVNEMVGDLLRCQWYKPTSYDTDNHYICDPALSGNTYRPVVSAAVVELSNSNFCSSTGWKIASGANLTEIGNIGETNQTYGKSEDEVLAEWSRSTWANKYISNGEYIGIGFTCGNISGASCNNGAFFRFQIEKCVSACPTTGYGTKDIKVTQKCQQPFNKLNQQRAMLLPPVWLKPTITYAAGWSDVMQNEIKAILKCLGKDENTEVDKVVLGEGSTLTVKGQSDMTQQYIKDHPQAQICALRPVENTLPKCEECGGTTAQSEGYTKLNTAIDATKSWADNKQALLDICQTEDNIPDKKTYEDENKQPDNSGTNDELRNCACPASGGEDTTYTKKIDGVKCDEEIQENMCAEAGKGTAAGYKVEAADKQDIALKQANNNCQYGITGQIWYDNQGGSDAEKKGELCYKCSDCQKQEYIDAMFCETGADRYSDISECGGWLSGLTSILTSDRCTIYEPQKVTGGGLSNTNGSWVKSSTWADAPFARLDDRYRYFDSVYGEMVWRAQGAAIPNLNVLNLFNTQDPKDNSYYWHMDSDGHNNYVNDYTRGKFNGQDNGYCTDEPTCGITGSLLTSLTGWVTGKDVNADHLLLPWVDMSKAVDSPNLISCGGEANLPCLSISGANRVPAAYNARTQKPQEVVNKNKKYKYGDQCGDSSADLCGWVASVPSAPYAARINATIGVSSDEPAGPLLINEPNCSSELDQWDGDTCNWYDGCYTRKYSKTGTTATGQIGVWGTSCTTIFGQEVCVPKCSETDCTATQYNYGDQYVKHDDGCTQTRLCGRSISVHPIRVNESGSPVIFSEADSCGEGNTFQTELGAESDLNEKRIDSGECKRIAGQLIPGTTMTHNFNPCSCKAKYYYAKISANSGIGVGGLALHLPFRSDGWNWANLTGSSDLGIQGLLGTLAGYVNALSPTRLLPGTEGTCVAPWMDMTDWDGVQGKFPIWGQAGKNGHWVLEGGKQYANINVSDISFVNNVLSTVFSGATISDVPSSDTPNTPPVDSGWWFDTKNCVFKCEGDISGAGCYGKVLEPQIKFVPDMRVVVYNDPDREAMPLNSGRGGDNLNSCYSGDSGIFGQRKEWPSGGITNNGFSILKMMAELRINNIGSNGNRDVYHRVISRDGGGNIIEGLTSAVLNLFPDIPATNNLFFPSLFPQASDTINGLGSWTTMLYGATKTGGSWTKLGNVNMNAVMTNDDWLGMLNGQAQGQGNDITVDCSCPNLAQKDAAGGKAGEFANCGYGNLSLSRNKDICTTKRIYLHVNQCYESAWWQVSGGNVYAGNNIESRVPNNSTAGGQCGNSNLYCQDTRPSSTLYKPDFDGITGYDERLASGDGEFSCTPRIIRGRTPCKADGPSNSAGVALTNAGTNISAYNDRDQGVNDLPDSVRNPLVAALRQRITERANIHALAGGSDYPNNQTNKAYLQSRIANGKVAAAQTLDGQLSGYQPPQEKYEYFWGLALEANEDLNSGTGGGLNISGLQIDDLLNKTIGSTTGKCVDVPDSEGITTNCVLYGNLTINAQDNPFYLRQDPTTHKGRKLTVFVDGNLILTNDTSSLETSYNSSYAATAVDVGNYLAFIVKGNVTIEESLGISMPNPYRPDGVIDDALIKRCWEGQTATLNNARSVWGGLPTAAAPLITDTNQTNKAVTYNNALKSAVGVTEGIIIANGDLTLNTYGKEDCDPALGGSAAIKTDKRYIHQGSMIIWGNAKLERDFSNRERRCDNNYEDNSYGVYNNRVPTESFIYRPDLVRNIPDWMRAVQSMIYEF